MDSSNAKDQDEEGEGKVAVDLDEDVELPDLADFNHEEEEEEEEEDAFKDWYHIVKEAESQLLVEKNGRHAFAGWDAVLLSSVCIHLSGKDVVSLMSCCGQLRQRLVGERASALCGMWRALCRRDFAWVMVAEKRLGAPWKKLNSTEPKRLQLSDFTVSLYKKAYLFYRQYRDGVAVPTIVRLFNFTASTVTMIPWYDFTPQHLENLQFARSSDIVACDVIWDIIAPQGKKVWALCNVVRWSTGLGGLLRLVGFHGSADPIPSDAYRTNKYAFCKTVPQLEYGVQISPRGKEVKSSVGKTVFRVWKATAKCLRLQWYFHAEQYIPGTYPKVRLASAPPKQFVEPQFTILIHFN